MSLRTIPPTTASPGRRAAIHALAPISQAHLMPRSYDEAGTTAKELAMNLELDADAAQVLAWWLDERANGTPATRLVWIELVLLSAAIGDIREAAAALAEIAHDTDQPEFIDAVYQASTLLQERFGRDARAFCRAWDAAATCPYARGAPLLSAIIPDLPMRTNYRLLTPEARLTLLVMANESGHRTMIVDAPTLGRRSGMPATEVRIGLEALVKGRWLKRRRSEIAARSMTVLPSLFLSLAAGPWGVPLRAPGRLRRG